MKSPPLGACDTLHFGVGGRRLIARRRASGSDALDSPPPVREEHGGGARPRGSRDRAAWTD
jgi:hypothetical protein